MTAYYFTSYSIKSNSTDPHCVSTSSDDDWSACSSNSMQQDFSSWFYCCFKIMMGGKRRGRGKKRNKKRFHDVLMKRPLVASWMLTASLLCSVILWSLISGCLSSGGHVCHRSSDTSFCSHSKMSIEASFNVVKVLPNAKWTKT